MNRESQEEMAALYALDLLKGRDRLAFAGAMREDSRLRAFTDELRETSSLLACCAGEKSPSANLKQRLQERIERDQAPAAAPSSRHRFPPMLGWAAAAAFATLALWLGQLQYATQAENDLLLQTQSLTDVALRSTRNQLEAEHIINRHELVEARQQLARLGGPLTEQHQLADFKVATLTSALNQSPQSVAAAVWNPTRQEGLLTVKNLPALPADKDYQLWIVDPRYPSPVDGGVFQVDPATGHARFLFKAASPIESVARFAVSLERKGGVAQAEGPMVLLGD